MNYYSMIQYRTAAWWVDDPNIIGGRQGIIHPGILTRLL